MNVLEGTTNMQSDGKRIMVIGCGGSGLLMVTTAEQLMSDCW